MSKKLTERHYHLLGLIEFNTENGRLTSQKEIVEYYPSSLYEDGYTWSEGSKTHDHCSRIWQDVQDINDSDLIDQIIIADNFTYKLAETEEEAAKYAEKFMAKGLKALKRHWNVIKKMKRDGQGKLFDADEYFETYLKKGIENEDTGTN